MSNVNELMKQLEDTKKQIEMIEKQLEEEKRSNKCKDSKYRKKTLKDGERYYYITSNDIIADSGEVWGYDERITNCSAFKTEEGAERVMKEQQLMRKLQRFSEENDGLNIDWSNHSKAKYSIMYDHISKVLKVGNSIYLQTQGVIYFKTEATALKALETFKGELLEYFKS